MTGLLKRFLFTFAVGILPLSEASAMEGAWSYMADPYAKNKTGFYADQQNIHIETEIFDYNQDLPSQKEALGYFRTDLLIDFKDESSLEVEILGDRSNQLNPDVDNITSYIRHLTPLASSDHVALSFLTQVILPMNRNSFEEEESTKPVLGLNVDFYQSKDFSLSLSMGMANTSDLELQEWKKTYITSVYLEWSLTEKLSTVVDLYFEREQGDSTPGYKWVIASLNYALSEELNLNLGTRTVGYEDAATNSMLGATLIF